MLSGPGDDNVFDPAAGAPLPDRDRRAGRRHAIVLLIGKVRHGDRAHDSICLVHDISSFGLMARFTLRPVIGETLAIEVRGMPPIPSIVRWVGGFRAGVEFIVPHALDPVFVARDPVGHVVRSPRFARSVPVGLCIAGRRAEAMLVDIAPGGAKLEIDMDGLDVSEGRPVQILLSATATIIFGTICWVRGNRFGVRFVAPLSITTLSTILDCQVPIPPPGDLAKTAGD